VQRQRTRHHHGAVELDVQEVVKSSEVAYVLVVLGVVKQSSAAPAARSCSRQGNRA
jgi:hypothetical protein